LLEKQKAKVKVRSNGPHFPPWRSALCIPSKIHERRGCIGRLATAI